MSGLGRRSHYRKHLTNSILNDFPEPTPPNERIAKVVGTRGSNQFEVVLALSSFKVTEVGDQDRTPQLALLPSKFRKLVWVKRNDYVICSCAVEVGEEKKEDVISTSAKVTGTTKTLNSRAEVDENDSFRVKALEDEEFAPSVPIGCTTTPSTSASASIDGGIRYMITHILYKDQVKHLKDVKKWPINDPFFNDEDGDGKDNAISISKVTAQSDGDKNSGDGIVYEDPLTRGEKSGVQSIESDKEGEDEGEEDEYVYENDLFVNTNRIAKMTLDDSSSSEDESE